MTVATTHTGSNAEQWLDELDPATTPARDAKHMRRIAAARDRLAQADRELHEAVAAARAAGDTWSMIGMALGTSRQAAYQRFGRDT
jgi:hypothetical protein